MCNVQLICKIGIIPYFELMRYTFAILFTLSFVLEPAAQRTDQARKVDSLLKLLAVSNEDTGKAMILLTLGSWYETNNQDSSAFYLEQGRRLSEKLKFHKGIYHYYRQSTILSYTRGDYTKALELSYKGLDIARKLKDSSMVVTMLNDIGILQGYFGNLEAQLDYTMQVKNIVEQLNDSAKLSGAYHNLSNCYLNLAQPRKAVETASYSIYIDRRNSRKNGYINRVYATLGQAYDALRMADSALYFYDFAIKESVRLNDKYAEGTIYGYKCNLLAGMNRFSDMMVAARASLSLSKELQSRQMLASSLYNLAYAQFFNNQNKEARQTIGEALAIAETDSLKDELKNSYYVLSYIAARDGDFSSSIMAKQKADSIQDAGLNERVVSRTTELEKKYETVKKDSQIKLQQAAIRRKSTFNYILIGGALALLGILLLLFRTQRQKQKLQQQRINELETEKQLMATEAVLKGEEQERTRLAKDLHDGLGGMLSGIKYSLNTMKGNLVMTPENQQAFERSMDMLDSSIQEMRRVAHNMMPEALVKFGLDTALRDFCNDINQTGAIKVNYQSIGMDNTVLDQTIAITLYRIVQELINNTMKHAAAGNAIVQLSKRGNQLSVTVEDDGKGFDTALLKKSKGIGWDNIQHRVEFLKGKLDVDSKPGKGTSVHIEMNT